MKPSEALGTFSGHQGTLLMALSTFCHILVCLALKEVYPEPQEEPPNLCSSFLLRIFAVSFIRGPSSSRAVGITHIKSYGQQVSFKRLYLNSNPI